MKTLNYITQNLDNLTEDILYNLCYIFALKNAVEYNGKANPNAVTKSVIGYLRENGVMIK